MTPFDPFDLSNKFIYNLHMIFMTNYLYERQLIILFSIKGLCEGKHGKVMVMIVAVCISFIYFPKTKQRFDFVWYLSFAKQSSFMYVTKRKRGSRFLCFGCFQLYILLTISLPRFQFRASLNLNLSKSFNKIITHYKHILHTFLTFLPHTTWFSISKLTGVLTTYCKLIAESN